MLDFLLVLGQIPGTSFQLTFNDIVAVCTVGFAIVWFIKRQPAKGNQTTAPRVLQLSTLEIPRSQIATPSGQQLLRTSAVPQLDIWFAWLNRHWRINQ